MIHAMTQIMIIRFALQVYDELQKAHAKNEELKLKLTKLLEQSKKLELKIMIL